MSEHSKLSYGPQRCRAVGEHILDITSYTIKAEAERNGGTLDLDQVLHIIDTIRKTPEGVWGYYKSSFDTCHGLSKQGTPEVYQRRNLLMRLLAHPFEHRLTNDLQAAENDVLWVPRPALKPFDIAMESMLGVASLQERRDVCAGIYDELQRTQGEDFCWTAFYDDPRAQSVLLETCLEIAPHFADFDKRIEWLVTMLKAHHDVPVGEQSIDFTEQDGVVLLTCLMEPSRGLLEEGADITAEQRAALTAMHAQLDSFGLRDKLLS